MPKSTPAKRLDRKDSMVDWEETATLPSSYIRCRAVKALNPAHKRHVWSKGNFAKKQAKIAGFQNGPAKEAGYGSSKGSPWPSMAVSLAHAGYSSAHMNG